MASAIAGSAAGAVAGLGRKFKLYHMKRPSFTHIWCRRPFKHFAFYRPLGRNRCWWAGNCQSCCYQWNQSQRWKRQLDAVQVESVEEAHGCRVRWIDEWENSGSWGWYCAHRWSNSRVESIRQEELGWSCILCNQETSKFDTCTNQLKPRFQSVCADHIWSLFQTALDSSGLHRSRTPKSLRSITVRPSKTIVEPRRRECQ